MEIKITPLLIIPSSPQERFDSLIEQWNGFEFSMDNQENSFKRKNVIDEVKRLLKDNEDLDTMKPIKTYNSHFGYNVL